MVAAMDKHNGWNSRHPDSRSSSRDANHHHRVKTMSEQNELILIVYAPALVGGDGRPLAVVHGMERALPGLRLEWEVSEDGRPIALPRRDAWLVEQTTEEGLPSSSRSLSGPFSLNHLER
jgi:hypothetical protein